jgi:hypothetical protein
MADNNSPSTPKLRFPDWQREYETALLETDPEMLAKRVHDAEGAIFLRQQAMVNSQDGHIERTAIEDALRMLRVIQLEKIIHPDWREKQ